MGLQRGSSFIQGSDLREDSPLIHPIIREIHDSTHEGYHKTLHRVRSVFYWKGMRSHIKDLIRQCDTCQRDKSGKYNSGGATSAITSAHANLASKGKSTIYVVVDRSFKYAHFIPISHPCTAVTVAQIFFDQVFKLHGMPQSIVCDRHPTFTSAFWKEIFKLNSTNFNFSSSYHPQIDGQTEVTNRTVEMYLRCFTSSKPKEWV